MFGFRVHTEISNSFVNCEFQPMISGCPHCRNMDVIVAKIEGAQCVFGNNVTHFTIISNIMYPNTLAKKTI
jgi:hypothetical protein